MTFNIFFMLLLWKGYSPFQNLSVPWKMCCFVLFWQSYSGNSSHSGILCRFLEILDLTLLLNLLLNIQPAFFFLRCFHKLKHTQIYRLKTFSVEFITSNICKIKSLGIANPRVTWYVLRRCLIAYQTLYLYWDYAIQLLSMTGKPNWISLQIQSRAWHLSPPLPPL